MFNFFKKFFHKQPLIDTIIDVTSVDNLYIWNGINVYKEYMIPTTGRKPRTWKDPNFQWIKIGFGKYSSSLGDYAGRDHESCSILDVWIDAKLNIVRAERNLPYIYNHSSRGTSFERKIDKLYDRLSDQRTFVTNNEQLMENINKLFSMNPEDRYEHCIESCGARSLTHVFF